MVCFTARILEVQRTAFLIILQLAYLHYFDVQNSKHHLADLHRFIVNRWFLNNVYKDGKKFSIFVFDLYS